MTTPEPSSLSAEDAALVDRPVTIGALADLARAIPCEVLGCAGPRPGDERDRHCCQRLRVGIAMAQRPVLTQTAADVRADERRRAGEREASLRERVEAVIYTWDPEQVDAIRAALAADEPEAAEGGAEREPEPWRVGDPVRVVPMPDLFDGKPGYLVYRIDTPPGHDESPEAGAREESE